MGDTWDGGGSNHGDLASLAADVALLARWVVSAEVPPWVRVLAKRILHVADFAREMARDQDVGQASGGRTRGQQHSF